jgi:hypothetical protein
MKELSLNILDIAKNSVKAGASLIRIALDEDAERLVITIADNGCGMKEEQVKSLRDPFFTTRTTRKVGLGIPFYALAAEQTGGSLEISSRHESEYPQDHGTVVTATFIKSSIDYTPLGDIISTIVTLIQGSDTIDFEFVHKHENGIVSLNTAEMREVLGEGIPLSSPEILVWIEENLKEQYSEASSN